MQFQLGAAVLAADGRAGTLDGLIFDPERSEVTGLVVRQGFLLPHDVVVPVEWVQQTDEEGVHVRGTSQEIADLPGFAQAQFAAPPEAWLPPSGYPVPASAWLFPASPYAVGAFAPNAAAPVPPPEPIEETAEEGVDVSQTTEVRCTDGVGGYVDRVITEGETDRVTHLIVQRGSLLTRDLLVPIAHVRETTDDAIYLDLTQEQLDAMPEFQEAEA